MGSLDKETSMDIQFYPTPVSLGVKAFNTFKNRSITRLLEPQAGRGDLVDVVHERASGRYSKVEVDCCEIDFNNQAILREKKYRIVGHDFLSYRGACIYSHILMNPPFASGVRHVFHAWDLLFHGELVAILNAETIRNPYTKERRFLVDIIEQHGAVEFITEAFMSPDTQRQTSVEVAIIHLEKKSNFKEEFIDNLKKEKVKEKMIAIDIEVPKDLVVTKSKIQNMVIAFECAVDAAKSAAKGNARANYYANMLGRSITDETTNCHDSESCVKSVSSELNEVYLKLKERAWSSVFRSTEVLDRLSSQAQKRLESEFSSICDLEFTVDNIYGFLTGLVEQQASIQIEMICDVFDMISKYHPKNRAYYQGWKSNQRHRVNAYRILMTRFIIPANRRDYYTWSNNLAWDDQQMFTDFDKVFSMLDGQHHKTPYGVVNLFSDKYKELSNGERCSSDYFDIRFYPKAGTFHIFPKREDLIDRLNRIVGKQRAWLPQDGQDGSTGFWEQYEKAEAVTGRMDLSSLNSWSLNYGSDSEKERESNKLLEQHEMALERMGIMFDGNSAITYQRDDEGKIPLLMAS